MKLGEALFYEQPQKYIVQSELYNNAYATPVLTAGKSFVLGKTNETKGIYENLPCIIFDDFTTDTKFVDFPFKVKSSAMKILTTNDKHDLRYLYHFLSTIKVDTELHKRYWISRFAELDVDLPPLPDQIRVASELDTVCGILAKQKRQYALLGDLIKSKFNEMFGDPKANPKGWQTARLKDIAVEKLSYGSGASAVKYDGEMRYVRITDISADGELNDDIVSPSEYDEKYLLNDGDVLFARSGATVGKTFRYSERWGSCIYAGYLIRLVPDKAKVLPDYVFAYTKTDYYQHFVELSQRTVAQPNINAQQYGDLIICVPPLELQSQFSSFVLSVDQLKSTLKSQLHQTETLYRALMQKYFGGTS